MCTAISDRGHTHLFGRTLDLEYSLGEKIVITPREFVFDWRGGGEDKSGYAIMGVAHIENEYPLYYDAINETGLGIAALNFPEFAKYYPPSKHQTNLASFELIPAILRKCKNVREAIESLDKVNVTNVDFSSNMKATPLHWLITDKNSCITAEPTADGLKVYENKIGALTNSPPFPYHKLNLSNYATVSPRTKENELCPDVELKTYSRGMGAIGLPGDFSSASRFVKAVFVKNNTDREESYLYKKEISRFFHVMDTVSVPKGCIKTDTLKSVSTVYTSCADTEHGIYYFTTYDCRRIRAVSMNGYDLDSKDLISFNMDMEEDLLYI